MRRSKLNDLLKQRPGYEVVYLLLESDRRRQELAEYVGSSGGTLQRWLEQAEREGLISRDAFLHDDEKYVEYSLDHAIPSDLIPVIKDRGGDGPRDPRSEFLDTISAHYWADPHSLGPEDQSSNSN